MTNPHEVVTAAEHEHNIDTVEALVRHQMSKSLGGVRGMCEAAIPGVLFTIVYLISRDLRLSIVVAAASAAVELVIRMAQRSSMQFVANAIVAVIIGWAAVRVTAHHGGTADQQALAFFVPGIVISAAYSIAMIISCLVRWPFVGFLVGNVEGDPFAWHNDRQIVALCSRLTWLFLLPGVIMVVIEGPIWFLGNNGTMHAATAVAVLGVLRVAVSWSVRGLSWGAMLWLLSRNHTPLEATPEASPTE